MKNEHAERQPEVQRAATPQTRAEQAAVPHGHPVEKPRTASHYDAGNGQGMVHRWAEGPTQDRPVLDGSTQSAEAEREVDNPWRGIDDPGLIFYPEHVPESKRHHLKRAA
ncbi:MAG: hypothetical protein J0H64_04415 [Actinobacteria bacterium]|nr:hypothetical protein [Actinomycetota bacterium]